MVTGLKSQTALSAAVMLALSGCNGGLTEPPPPPKPAPQLPATPQIVDAENIRQARTQWRLAVDGEGLRLFHPITGAARAIAFGQPQGQVLNALEQVRGRATKGTNEDCGAGRVDYATWSDGLSVVFQGDRFVGWGIDSRSTGSLATASGIGPGSTRAQIDDVYADLSVKRTSLGTEFSAGGFSGLIGGTKASSRITDMWAGTNCVAR